MPFSIVRDDITRLCVDAIVNAANTELSMGGGVCGAIFRAAGESELRAACAKLAPIKVGDAVITPGFGLFAKYVIHTAGPVYRGGDHSEAALLRACYVNSLELAVENRCKSVAFPLISSGVYGYPRAQALKIATTAILEFLEDHELEVTLVVFDRETTLISRQMFDEVKAYIDENYAGDYDELPRSRLLRSLSEDPLLNSAMAQPVKGPVYSARVSSIENRVKNIGKPFSAVLLRLIDEKNMSDVEVYKRANIDRRLFSKIRRGKGYTPGKRTVLALSMALRLSHAETCELLRCAGYALSASNVFDVIVEYFIIKGYYDIHELNQVLFAYEQQPLGV